MRKKYYGQMVEIIYIFGTYIYLVLSHKAFIFQDTRAGDIGNRILILIRSRVRVHSRFPSPPLVRQPASFLP